MLICNLNTLIAERNLKISKISKDTGISRTTLTSLTSNYSQGIQFDTLNTLCMYLNVSPEQFFSYVPFDLNIVHHLITAPNKFNIDFNLTNGIYNNNFSLNGIFNVSIRVPNSDNGTNFYIEFSEISAEDSSYISKILKTFSISTLNKVEQNIITKVFSVFENGSACKEMGYEGAVLNIDNFHFNWNKVLF